MLYLDLNTGDYEKKDGLVRRLDTTLREWEARYDCYTENTLSLRFENVIKNVREKTGRQVVILIDEYEKPLLQTIENEEIQEENRKMLKSFYSNIKQKDDRIKFAFITGITKFSKVSIFSDLNNLEDMSMDEQYNAICGMTEEELNSNFEEGITSLSDKIGKTYEETCGVLRERYDGYHFSYGAEGIYNPFSIIQALKKQKIDNFWFHSGTPTILVKKLQKCDYDLRLLQEGDVESDMLNSVDSLKENPIPLIYQSGYLTIKDYDEEFDSYRLGFPNKEVEQSFLKFILPYYTPNSNNQNCAFVGNFIRDLRNGDPEQFMQRFQTFFDDADYRVAGKLEVYFQNAMYIIFRLMGFFTQVERTTGRGRVDVVVQTPDYIYVMELKVGGSAHDALRQIEENGYAKPFAMDKRKLYRIGVDFSSEIRGIKEWICEG